MVLHQNVKSSLIFINIVSYIYQYTTNRILSMYKTNKSLIAYYKVPIKVIKIAIVIYILYQ